MNRKSQCGEFRITIVLSLCTRKTNIEKRKIQKFRYLNFFLIKEYIQQNDD